MTLLQNGDTPLLLATKEDHSEVVQLFLSSAPKLINEASQVSICVYIHNGEFDVICNLKDLNYNYYGNLLVSFRRHI